MSDTQIIQSKKWVVVFLIYSDFRVNREFPLNESFRMEIDCLLGDILNVSIDKNKCRLYVIFNSIKYLFNDGQFSVEDNTILCKIENSKGYGKNRISDCRLIPNDTSKYDIDPQTGKFKLQTPENLKTIFDKLEVNKEEEEIILITWDHGAAFGIFTESVFTEGDIRAAKPIDADFSKYPNLKQFWDAVENTPDYKNLKERIGMLPTNSMKSYYVYSRGHRYYKFDKKEADKGKLLKSAINSGQLNHALHLTKGNNHITLALSPETEISARENDESLLFPNDFDLFKTDFLDKNTAFTAELSGDNVSEILRNDELAKAIYLWLGDHKKVGVLLMMNCWMMNLHTMYSMKDVVKCLVAPQTDIGVPGYNCHDILRYFQNNTLDKITPENLAAECVRTCENDFAKKRLQDLEFDNKFPIDALKVFAVNMEKENSDKINSFANKINLLKMTIGSFINLLVLRKQSNDSALKYMFKYMRALSFDFSHDKYFLIDILNWFKTLLFINNENLIPPENKIILYDIINGQERDESFVIEKTRGSLAYIESKGSITHNEPTCFSIFFPYILFDTNEKLLENVKHDLFINHFLLEWKPFINFIYDNPIII